MGKKAEVPACGKPQALKSRQWSCSELGEGSTRLVESKKEVDDDAAKRIEAVELGVNMGRSTKGQQ